MSRPISIIISSLRPERLEKVIDSTAMHSDLVEVIVASPTPPKPRDFVKHVPVPPPGTPNELSWSQKNNLAVRHSCGEYLVFNNDDIHFRAGWAPQLLERMKSAKKKRPYLAAFHMATHGELVPRHTAFGFLYANHACICKADLPLVGGTLFDERFWLGYNDVDLSLRVWHAGGEVSFCPGIVLDSERDKPHPVTNPYRAKHYDRDTNTFRQIWFPRYFWKFVSSYSKLKTLFSPDDHVLPPERQNNGAFLELIFPYFVTRCFELSGFKNLAYVQTQRNRLVRVVNRRWHQLDYQFPYSQLP